MTGSGQHEQHVANNCSLSIHLFKSMRMRTPHRNGDYPYAPSAARRARESTNWPASWGSGTVGQSPARRCLICPPPPRAKRRDYRSGAAGARWVQGDLGAWGGWVGFGGSGGVGGRGGSPILARAARLALDALPDLDAHRVVDLLQDMAHQADRARPHAQATDDAPPKAKLPPNHTPTPPRSPPGYGPPGRPRAPPRPGHG